METRKTKNYEFHNCVATDEFYKKANEIIADMDKNKAPYSGKLKLEISLEDAEVTTESKHSTGLSDLALRMFDEMENLCIAIAKKGKEPGKIEVEIEIEKEL